MADDEIQQEIPEPRCPRDERQPRDEDDYEDDVRLGFADDARQLGICCGCGHCYSRPQITIGA